MFPAGPFLNRSSVMSGHGAQNYRKHRKHVAERDGHICWLCGNIVPSFTPTPNHPMHASLDHYETQASGGARNDPRNMRLTHRICNSKRQQMDPLIVAKRDREYRKRMGLA